MSWRRPPSSRSTWPPITAPTAIAAASRASADGLRTTTSGGCAASAEDGDGARFTRYETLIAGAGSVLVFLPQIAILFLFIGLLFGIVNAIVTTPHGESRSALTIPSP